MHLQASFPLSQRLPLKGSLTNAYNLSYLVALSTAVLSIAGLLYQDAIYPTDTLKQTFVANDAANIIVGLPVLIVTMWLSRNGRLAGLLGWPGALLYGFYNYIAYVIGRPFDWLTLIFAAVIFLSGLAIYSLITVIDHNVVKAAITGKIPRKTAGWVLLIFGILFTFLAVSLIIGGGASQEPLPTADLGVATADIILSLLLMAGGLLLLLNKPLGYGSGLGLLMGASLLFIGLIIFFFVRPFLTDLPFDLIEVVTVFVMGLICFVPFILYLRGVWSEETS